jgi:hypothetical protein
MKKYASAMALLLVIVTGSNAYSQHDPKQPFQGTIGKTLDDSRQWWPDKIKAPEGAPNVVWILIDDVGFGASATFGGLVQTPNFDSLADSGLRYTNFHTTSLCSPTRAALLTGRNSHNVAMGHHPELATGFPGYVYAAAGENSLVIGELHFVQ